MTCQCCGSDWNVNWVVYLIDADLISEPLCQWCHVLWEWISDR